MTTAFDQGNIPEITLRHRLRIAREHAGLNQQQLAERMGVARSTVSNAEMQKTVAARSTINLWAVACGVPASWLRTGQPPTDGPDPNNRTLDYKDQPQKISQLSSRLRARQTVQQVQQHIAS